ncbi:MAG TPA: D-aminoacyl-tRNA deacylase [Salinisphaeraceae bacterium]|nr:D-aminoacyl-tRNA deacylase [Salinisphaeraceae bacterium]
MIALLQRVRSASVAIDGTTVAAIERGILALVAAERDDDEARARRLAERVGSYRLFSDTEGRMNLNVAQAGGAILAVPQFTLAADTRRGNRPGFSRALAGAPAEHLFNVFADALAQGAVPVALGRFGADMQVALVNDGPVTFWLQS